MVVISSVVSVVSFSVLGLLAELVVSSIARSLCFAFDFVWFRRALLFVRFLIDCGFGGVYFASFPLDARDAVDFAVLAVFLILIFCSLCCPYSSSSISRCSSLLCDFSPDDPSCSPRESPPFPMCSAWGTNATFATPVRSKTTTNPTMLASWHAIPTKASIDAAKHHSFSFFFLVKDCSNRKLTSIVPPRSPRYAYIPIFVSVISVFLAPNYLQ